MRLNRDAVEDMLVRVDRIVATRGPAIRDVRLSQISPADGLTLLMGPTGNLRAPTLRIGRTLVVGFSIPLYSTCVETLLRSQASRRRTPS